VHCERATQAERTTSHRNWRHACLLIIADVWRCGMACTTIVPWLSAVKPNLS
jgi:hypothetical protein